MPEEGKNKYDWSIYDGDTLLAYKKRDQEPVVIMEHKEKLIKKFLDDYYDRLSIPDFKEQYYKMLSERSDLQSENRKLTEQNLSLTKDLTLKEAMFTEYEKVIWFIFDDIMSSLSDKSFQLTDALLRKAREKRKNPDGTW